MDMNLQSFLKACLAGMLGAVLGAASIVFALGGHTTTTLGPSAAVAAGEDDQQQIVAAVKHVEPSVVALEVTINGTQVIPNDPFSQLFGGGGGFGGGERLQRFHARASGSGFVYASNGLIVTNDHVVHGASKVQVVFANGDRVPGRIYSEDAAADLALVKVDNYAKLPPALEFASSHDVQQGEFAIAIGEPFELKRTVTLGVVSGFDRDETIGGRMRGAHEFKGLLQTSAPINPGNSGGPLIDLNGRVIGVNQSVAAPAQGIGFAVPADTAKSTLASLQAHPGVQTAANTGFIGVQLEALDGNLRQQLSYTGDGVAIAGVVGGSAADQAGLQPGDVIQRVDGKGVGKPDDVASLIRGTKPGKTVSLEVWSSGTRHLVGVKVGASPNAAG
jgi:serine protease Do